ncbi:MAG: hypothetical protein WCN98_17585, partial [Verrucomicrobiaceae bacterium]
TDEVLALQVLLVLATGEPVEVIRRVTMADVVATSASVHDPLLEGLTPTQQLHLLARAGLVDEYAVAMFKARAGEAYVEKYAKSKRACFNPWNAAIVLTAAAREDSGSDVLWLTRGRAGAQPAPYPNMRFDAWAQRSLADPKAVSTPFVFRRLRKTQITKEALASPSRYLRDGRRHSDSTYLAHYTNSSVLRAEAGRILVEAITTRFDAATSGPTIITPDAERLLPGSGPIPTFSESESAALRSGTTETPMAACRDPLSSPHAPEGHPCSVVATGACFACPNAVVLERHLPAALRILELTEPSEAANIGVWMTQWKPIRESILHAVLPAFPQESVDAAARTTGAVLVDARLLNDLGESDGE